MGNCDVLDWTPELADPDDSIACVHGLMSGVEKIELIQEYVGKFTAPLTAVQLLSPLLWSLVKSSDHIKFKISEVSRLFRTRNAEAIWSYMQRPHTDMGFGGVNFGEVAYAFAPYLDACVETILAWKKK